MPTNIDPVSPVQACGSYALPAITGTNLSSSVAYFTQPNGLGTSPAIGSSITSSQTLYLFDGLTGCSDEETLAITIDQPTQAGNDQLLTYCGVGTTYNLNTFLSPTATSLS